VSPPQFDRTVAFYRDQLGPHGVTRCEEIERLSEHFNGFWIANPAGIAHSIAPPAEDPGL
jgi:catechol 2,3-dioxygenase-like lactoylglutathione lyase family enzyme